MGRRLLPKGLNLTTYAGAIKGGKDGPVIVPGDAANSKLIPDPVQRAAILVNYPPRSLRW